MYSSPTEVLHNMCLCIPCVLVVYLIYTYVYSLSPQALGIYIRQATHAQLSMLQLLKKTICAYVINIALEVPEKFQCLRGSAQRGA